MGSFPIRYKGNPHLKIGISLIEWRGARTYTGSRKLMVKEN
jgi:hypothetical protein